MITRYILKKILTLSEYSPLALVWMIKSLILDFPLRLYSFKRLPQIAEQMGMHYKTSRYKNQFGEITGNFDSCEIIAKPGDSMNSRIEITTTKSIKRLTISTSNLNLNPEPKETEFKTDNFYFNLFFKTRIIDRNYKENFLTKKNFIDSAVSFYNKYILVLESLYINGNSMNLNFRYGFYFFTYIPSWRFKKLIHDIVELSKEYNRAAE